MTLSLKERLQVNNAVAIEELRFNFYVKTSCGIVRGA
jgi:hypothetical protein